MMRRTAALLLVAWMSACATTDGAMSHAIKVDRMVVTPSGPPSRQFGGPVEHRLSPTEEYIDAMLKALPMDSEPAMHRMTRQLARLAPDRVNVPADLVDGLMAWSGLVDPPPRIVIVEMPEDTARCDRDPRQDRCLRAIRSLVEQVEADAQGSDNLRYGIGVARLGAATRMIVALVDRSVELEPIPTVLQLGQSIAIEGRLLGARSLPSVEVIDAGGHWSTLPTQKTSRGEFSTRLRCGPRRGALQVEVLAEGAHGPEVAANFPIYCGTTRPSKIGVAIERLGPDITPEAIAQAIFAYLNDDRQLRGLPPLRWDDRAAAVAEAHSRDMQRTGFVGHRSPSSGDVRKRFDKGGIQGAVIRENVARGYGPRGIHDSLMRSPGHRVNVLATDVTHVGIGVVIGEPETNVANAPRPVFATQNFFRKPGENAPPPARMVPVAKERIDAARVKVGRARVRWDPALERAAAKLARGYAAGRTPDLQSMVNNLDYRSVETHRAQSGDFEALTRIDLWNEPELDAGIAIATVQSGGKKTFLMVILVGKR